MATLGPVSAPQPEPAAELTFVKGHGTENDFVLLPDPRGELELTAELARTLSDRRSGIGADGVIRVAPSPEHPDRFLMDYRNSDGSPAEMCGNGARVFARFLVDAGYQPAGTFTFDVRGGERVATVDGDGDVSVGLDVVTLGPDGPVAVVAGREHRGRAVDVGNPHLVTVLGPDDPELADLDLAEPPSFSASDFPDGVNIEFVSVIDDDRVRMRVYERGAGETRSCGTGTAAAAAVQLARTGRRAGTVTVDVPGGTVHVTIDDDGRATLRGPAVLVYSGTLNPAVLAG